MNKNYTDVTKKYIKKSIQRNIEVKKRNFIKLDGVIYTIKKGDNAVVHDNNLQNVETANWLSRTFGGKVFINPRME